MKTKILLTIAATAGLIAMLNCGPDNNLYGGVVSGRDYKKFPFLDPKYYLILEARDMTQWVEVTEEEYLITKVGETYRAKQ